MNRRHTEGKPKVARVQTEKMLEFFGGESGNEGKKMCSCFFQPLIESGNCQVDEPAFGRPLFEAK